jgi:hypothetical protein
LIAVAPPGRQLKLTVRRTRIVSVRRVLGLKSVSSAILASLSHGFFVNSISMLSRLQAAHARPACVRIGESEMPVKKRIPKRRIDPAAELEAFEMIFECGSDFFLDLDALGYRTDAEKIAGARSAWERLGLLFLARRTESGTPWAMEQFGKPGSK